MTLQDRITVSSEETILRLEQALDHFRRFQYDGRYKELLGETLLGHVEAWDTRIRSRRKDPFTIVVVGEFKRGKSSFINALLGEEILSTDVTPETVTMNRLNYGVHKNEAVLSGGRRIELTDDELRRNRLETLMTEAGEPIRQLELWRPNEWLKDIRMIDTPGMNDVLGDFDSIVADALSQADAVIYVYSVSAPLSRSEQMYLRYTILPQRYTKLFLVGNYGDLMETEETLERMREFLEKRTRELLPGERVYLVSALDEICRAKEVGRPCQALESVLEAEFSLLRRELEHLIEEKKTVVAADRMQRMTRGMAEELENDLNNIEKGLEMDSSQLAREQETLQSEQSRQMEQLKEAQEKIHHAVEVMKADAWEWTGKVLQKLEQEDLSVYSVHDILQYYSYYCIEVLQTAIQACLEQHREELLEQMSEISDVLGKNLAGTYTAGDKLGFCLRLDNNTWTRGDSITLAVTQLSGNPILNAFTDLTGSLLRKTEIEADKDKIISSIQSKYPGLRKNVQQNLDAKYTGLAHSADKLLAEYYEGQIERAKSALNQYREASRKSETEKEAVTKAVKEMREALSGFAKE